jgi:predicted SprT family Zn-dependent metalloprotease
MDLVSVEKLAKKLISEHLGQYGWEFKWSNAKKTFGTCSYKRNFLGISEGGVITLSRPLCLLNDEKQVTDTILHEIAHGLTKGDGHGLKWKRACIKIGAKPERCFTSKNVLLPEMKYTAICGGCSKRFNQNRITLNRRSACICQNNKKWEEKLVLKFVKNY